MSTPSRIFSFKQAIAYTGAATLITYAGAPFIWDAAHAVADQPTSAQLEDSSRHQMKAAHAVTTLSAGMIGSFSRQEPHDQLQADLPEKAKVYYSDAVKSCEAYPYHPAGSGNVTDPANFKRASCLTQEANHLYQHAAYGYEMAVAARIDPHLHKKVTLGVAATVGAQLFILSLASRRKVALKPSA